MKKSFIRFFQLVCLLLFFGSGQLNAHPGMRISHASSAHFQETQKVYLFDIQNISTLDAQLSTTNIHKNVTFISDNFGENENEVNSYKKLPVSKHSLTFAYPVVQVPEYLWHNSRSSLAFCKQLSFTPVSKRCVTFQVFRI